MPGYMQLQLHVPADAPMPHSFEQSINKPFSVESNYLIY